MGRIKLSKHVNDYYELLLFLSLFCNYLKHKQSRIKVRKLEILRNDNYVQFVTVQIPLA